MCPAYSEALAEYLATQSEQLWEFQILPVKWLKWAFCFQHFSLSHDSDSCDQNQNSVQGSKKDHWVYYSVTWALISPTLIFQRQREKLFSQIFVVVENWRGYGRERLVILAFSVEWTACGLPLWLCTVNLWFPPFSLRELRDPDSKEVSLRWSGKDSWSPLASSMKVSKCILKGYWK